MGAYAGPDISENGLVLSLDAGNLKSYDKFENLVTDVATDYNYTFAGQLIATALDIAPDGDNVLCKHDLTGATSPYLNCRANTTLSAGQTYTMSMWLKGTTSFSASFAFVGETTSEIYANTANITTSWNRFTLTFTLTNTQTSSRLQVFFATQGNDKVISVWGAQLERGSEATDYTTRTSGVAKLRGTTWTDLSGIGNTGTLVNGVGYNGSNLGSLSFDGTNDYVNAPLTKSASCTFSCWARTTTLATNPMLFNAGPSGVGPDLFFYNGKISWNTWDGDANPLSTTPTSVTNGDYHHYVVVNDALSNTKLYYDGVLLGTATYRTAANNTNLTIGGNTSSYMWNGNISNFTIHNRVLTENEIKQNFNAQRGRFGI